MRVFFAYLGGVAALLGGLLWAAPVPLATLLERATPGSVRALGYAWGDHTRAIPFLAAALILAVIVAHHRAGARLTDTAVVGSTLSGAGLAALAAGAASQTWYAGALRVTERNGWVDFGWTLYALGHGVAAIGLVTFGLATLFALALPWWGSVSLTVAGLAAVPMHLGVVLHDPLGAHFTVAFGAAWVLAATALFASVPFPFRAARRAIAPAVEPQPSREPAPALAAEPAPRRERGVPEESMA